MNPIIVRLLIDPDTRAPLSNNFDSYGSTQPNNWIPLAFKIENENIVNGLFFDTAIQQMYLGRLNVNDKFTVNRKILPRFPNTNSPELPLLAVFTTI